MESGFKYIRNLLAKIRFGIIKFQGEEGAESILTLRCLSSGPHLEASWQARRSILAEIRRRARRWIEPKKDAA